MDDETGGGAGVVFEEAMKKLMMSRRTLFSYVKSGVIKVVEGGRRGRGKQTLLDASDVNDLAEKRQAELERKLREARGT